MTTVQTSIQMRIFLLLPIVLASCMLTKSNESIQQTDKSEIVFLVLRISKDSIQKKNVIEFVSKTKSEGKIKNDNQENLSYDNYLTIEVYEKDKRVNTIIMEHPLFKQVEYLDGNTLSSKSVVLDKQEFFIRLQIKGESAQIKVYETLKNTTQKELTTLKL